MGRSFPLSTGRSLAARRWVNAGPGSDLIRLGVGCLLAWGNQATGAQGVILVKGDEPWLDEPRPPASLVYPSDAPTTAGSVSILAIHPPLDTALRQGARVRISVEVAYTQPGQRATLALSLQEPLPQQRPLAAALLAVQEPQGRVTLSADVVVPATPTMWVHVPLYTREGVATAVVETRSYRVLRQP